MRSASELVDSGEGALNDSAMVAGSGNTLIVGSANNAVLIGYGTNVTKTNNAPHNTRQSSLPRLTLHPWLAGSGRGG